MPYLPAAPALGSLALTVVLLIERPWATVVTAAWLVIGLAVHRFFARQQAKERRRQAPVVFERAPVRASRYRVLVPLANPEHVDGLMLVGSALAQYNQGEVAALNVIAVPEVLPVEEALRFQSSAEEVLEQAREAAQGYDVPIRGLARAGPPRPAGDPRHHPRVRD
jgi:hypothetical protein